MRSATRYFTLPREAFAPGLRPHLGLNRYKPFVLLYTTGGRQSLFLQNGGTRRACSPSRDVRDDFFSKESRPACPVHVPRWCPWQDLHLHWSAFEADVSALDYTGMNGNAPGRTRTDTEPGLSRLPLLIGLREQSKVPMAGVVPAPACF